MRKELTLKQRALLLRTVRVVQWLGVLWNFAWWAVAIYELYRAPRLSDAIGNAIAYALLGGFGFLVAFTIGWIMKLFDKSAPADPEIKRPPSDEGH